MGGWVNEFLNFAKCCFVKFFFLFFCFQESNLFSKHCHLVSKRLLINFSLLTGTEIKIFSKQIITDLLNSDNDKIQEQTILLNIRYTRYITSLVLYSLEKMHIVWLQSHIVFIWFTTYHVDPLTIKHFSINIGISRMSKEKITYKIVYQCYNKLGRFNKSIKFQHIFK